MATRKKKETVEMPGTIGSAKLVFPSEPTVVKGSHLTVTTYPDGRTELEWDDDALLRDVQMAILSVESRIPVTVETKPKRTRKAKE
jgi:hypothetical protein